MALTAFGAVVSQLAIANEWEEAKDLEPTVECGGGGGGGAGDPNNPADVARMIRYAELRRRRSNGGWVGRVCDACLIQ